ncbi:MAG: cohesin domain-containing protein [Halobacteriota archaeon]
MINDVTDVVTAGVDVTYDPSVIVVTDVDVDQGKFDIYAPENIDNEKGCIRVGGYLSGDEGLNGNVILANLTISPKGSYGEISDLDIEITSELKDSSNNPIEPDVIDGFFYIGKNGDVNADRVIDSYDSLYIAKGIAGIEELVGASEVSGDGIVDAYDCVYLARHAAGIPGYEELR